LAVLHLNTLKQVGLFTALIAGYWCLLLFVPAPGFQPYDLTMEGNLAGYIDRQLIPGKLYYRYGDNEGILSTIPAIATTLLGVFAGEWLRTPRGSFVKVWGLYLAALGCLMAGYLWSFWFPLNKILWTSSFVLVTGGYSLGLLATFYLLIDVLQFRRWAFFFIVIGMNAITIYMLQEIVDFSKISEVFLGGVISCVGTWFATSLSTVQVKAAQELLLMLGVLTIKWLLLWYLYRKETFLKV
jgi:predicted acyltransferase